MDLGLLDARLGAGLILPAAQAVADGKHDDQFVVDIFQTGSGTSTNMNTNEVIAGIANEQFGTGVRGGKSPVHPNDAVNMGQSSNDVIPTAIHVAALEAITQAADPRAEEPAREARREGARRSTRSSRSAARTCKTPCRSGSGRSSRATRPRSSTACGGWKLSATSLAELPIGGTAVGTGINTHAEFPQRMAAQLSQRDRPGRSDAGGQQLRGDGQPRRRRRGLRHAQDGGHQPVEHRQQHPLAGLGTALRDRRDPDPRASARQLDHAGEGQPGHPRGRDDGRRAGRGQRRDDRLGATPWARTSTST